MKKPQKMKNLLKILKDKVSILKTTLSLSSKPTASFHLAVLRATTLHHPHDPPPIDAVLALANHQHRPSSSGSLIHALLHRLHGTQSSYVALKCLLTLHHVILNGSPALKEHILCYSSGPLFNVSGFKDESDRDTWELSEWVRWYGDVLDYGISIRKYKGERIRLSSLVGMIERICGAPESLHYQRLTLVYEIIKIIKEDYRLVMREVNDQLTRISRNDVIQDLSDEKLEELFGDLKRIENCKEKLLLMFLNTKRNDGVWELIEEVREDVEEVKRRREEMRVVKFQGTESTQWGGDRVSESRMLAVVQGTRGKRWLDVEWNPLVASFA